MIDQLKLKKISLSIEIDENIPQTFQTDKQRLKQILLNLLTNALKFTNLGEIIISFQLVQERPSIIQVSIQDTGIGIQRQKLKGLKKLLRQPQYFSTQPLLRINNTGICLGLMISQNIALVIGEKDCQGITVESQENVGSIFSFTVE
eukprot:TRINITY_DN10732_c0_g1_i2.p1 TRINITY_DN10732_c0_g1~~TRINITY_DN10732_c0_g1_i2.p1  ORF type:complete len:147 (+),score=1.66 TRINITY_DN10732_c0_g1_i2:198-638(+)